MSSQHATSPAVPSTGTATPAAGRVRVGVVAAALGVSAVASSVNLLARPLPAEDFNAYGAAAPVRDALWLFSVTAAASTAVAYIAVGLAVCLLVPARGGLWACAGAVLTALGGVGYAAGFFAIGAVHWYATSNAIPADAGTALLDHVDDNPGHVLGPQLVGFLLFVVGYVVLLSVALWRSRAVPRWLPVVVPVTFLGTMIAGTGVAFDVANAVFMATMVVIAWYLWSGATRAASR